MTNINKYPILNSSFQIIRAISFSNKRKVFILMFNDFYMRVPYTFNVNARFTNEEQGDSWVPIDRLPAARVPMKGESFIIDETLAKTIFGKDYKEIVSLYPINLGRVNDVCHYINLRHQKSNTDIWTRLSSSLDLDRSRRFNGFVKEWNANHLVNDESLPHERYNKHSPTYWYDLQVDVARGEEAYSRIIRNVPFEVKVTHGHNFYIRDNRGRTQFDSALFVSEARSIVPAKKGGNSVIHVDLVGIKEDITRIRPELQEKQFERLDLFERNWNASKKDASVA